MPVSVFRAPLMIGVIAILHFVGKWFQRFRIMRIANRMILGYVALVLTPTIVVTNIIYNQLNQSLLEQFLHNRQSYIESLYSNLKIQWAEIESIYYILQDNIALTGYMDGRSRTALDLVYSYNKEIAPSIAFARRGNPFVKGIRIYIHRADVFLLSEVVFSNSTGLADDPNYNVISDLPAHKGIWLLLEEKEAGDQLPSISYYHKMYDDQYSKELGFLKISVSDELLHDFFERILESVDGQPLFIVDSNDRILYHSLPVGTEDSREFRFAEWKAENDRRSNKMTLLHSLTVPELNIQAVVYGHASIPHVDSNRMQLSLVFISLSSFLILSIVYYFIASSLALKIIRLSRHMRQIDYGRLTPFQMKSDSVEFGYLVSTYNSMIERIRQLIDSVRQVEALKTKAEIKMLQAQIKPHFLYNTLESMRMMAQLNGDREVAEMAYTLGSLLRYSLAAGKDESTLEQEIENARDYCKIQKVRMGDRLQYSIELDRDCKDFKCPRLILQPLVENCIIHGFANFRGIGFIKLSAKLEGARVRITIRDNGSGMTEEKLLFLQYLLNSESLADSDRSENRGIGLCNVHQRVIHFYGSPSGLSISSQLGAGTEYVLKLQQRGNG